MVRQLLLPKEGGGSLRRFLNMRSRLFRDQWDDSRPMRGPVPLFDFRRRDDAADVKEAINPKFRGLFPGWRVSDDSVIGGFSNSRMQLVDGVEGGGDAIDKESNNNANNGASASVSSSSSSSPPFLRWSGNMSTEINHQSHLARNVTRSGFAAILSPEFPLAAPLKDKYYALEICCRTDGRTYAVNLHVESYFPEDMYQGFIVGGKSDSQQRMTMGRGERSRDVMNATSSTMMIQPESDNIDDEGEDKDKQTQQQQSTEEILDVREYLRNKQQQTETQQPSEEILDVREHLRKRRNLLANSNLYSDDDPYHGHPPAGFQRFILPFREFALTSRGRMRHTQRDLDGGINIESIGFTLMDGKDGDFCFDLVSLRAVNILEGEVVLSLEDEAREEEFENSLKKKKKSSKSSTEDEDGGEQDEDEKKKDDEKQSESKS